MSNLHSLVSNAAAHLKADLGFVETKITTLGRAIEQEVKDLPLEATAAVRERLQSAMNALALTKEHLAAAEALAKPSVSSTPTPTVS